MLEKGNSCRFNFPRLPSDEFLIAQPLPDDMDESLKQQNHKEQRHIKIEVEAENVFRNEIDIAEFTHDTHS